MIRRVHAALVFLVLFDLTLVVWVFAFPDWWFQAFHGVGRVDPQGLLPRMGSNWAAFLLFQAVAVVRWKQDPVWLAVVAGIRLSDIFTDWTYLLACQDITWFGRGALLLASPMNMLFGWWLLKTWRDPDLHAALAAAETEVTDSAERASTDGSQ